MDWSEQALRQLFDAGYHDGWQDYPNRLLVGDFWPYQGGSALEVDAFLHDIANDLGASEQVSVETDFNSFGSGYASFVELFCFKKDGSSRRPYLGSGDKFSGIVVYVSRLAPVAAYGAGERTRHAHGGSSSFLSYDTLDTMPPGNWNAFLEEVTAKLTNHGIKMANAATLNAALPFDAKIETNLGDYPHRVFDLLFYWYD